jgi:hypothetical protein
MHGVPFPQFRFFDPGGFGQQPVDISIFVVYLSRDKCVSSRRAGGIPWRLLGGLRDDAFSGATVEDPGHGVRGRRLFVIYLWGNPRLRVQPAESFSVQGG